MKKKTIFAQYSILGFLLFVCLSAIMPSIILFWITGIFAVFCLIAFILLFTY